MKCINNRFLFFVYLVTLLSCKQHTEKGIEVIIKNSSSSTIHGLEVGTSEKLAAINSLELNPDQELNTFLPMKENKTDGSYGVRYTLADGRKENLKVGYYTNGAPLERSMYITIENDTTLVTFSKY